MKVRLSDSGQSMDPALEPIAIKDSLTSIRQKVIALNKRTMDDLNKSLGEELLEAVGLPGTPSSKLLDYQLVTGMFDSDIYSDMTVSRVGEIGVISVLYSVIATKASREQHKRSRRIIAALDRKRV